MNTRRNRHRLALGATMLAASIALTGCGQGDPFGSGEQDETGTIVIGSQAYYSNEIVAEIYAQALENAGFEVERRFSIGQREAYLPSIENGEVDLFPEYTGNLLQYYLPDTTATKAQDVYDELVDVLPEGLVALEMSPATDQDSYNVTSRFAEENGLRTIGDLADIDDLVLGGAPELEERPYGPKGLEAVYGVSVRFEPTGETTVEALLAGLIDVANVFSADPRIAQDDLVTLEDPEGLFLASNIVPIAGVAIADDIAEVIDRVSAAMSPEELVQMNVRSTRDQESSRTIATDWLQENGLL